MNYSELVHTLKKASLFDLCRLSIAICNEMENPDRIQQLRQSFKEDDNVSYFDESCNSFKPATVIQKNTKAI